MATRNRRERDRPLLAQLRWFVRLRWIAGVAVLLTSAAALWVAQDVHAAVRAAVGGFILAYNVLLWSVLRRDTDSRLIMLAWAQLLLDLACLTVLAVLTGGARSHVLGFFVFHVVFAALLLPRRMSYAVAAVAVAMLAAGLWAAAKWPESSDRLPMLGWVVTLFVTAWLANTITRGLRRQRRRLTRQNRRIRAMTRKLRRQQQGMIRQEKLAAAGRMAAGVAHEVANPLASMDALLQMMERRPEKMKPENIATLREQVARINKVVRQMTSFAHPGEGQWQEVQLNEVVEKALNVVRFDPRGKRARIERELAVDSPMVRAVPEALQQVIINLAINALDALEGVEGGTLTLRTATVGGTARIEVIDNGHGITPAHRRRLFEPFFTTKPVGKGTGLGLSISYTLVQQHGGEIHAESRGEGAGARFIVTLPLSRQPAAVTG
jgi:signal transduction histidine kinase